MMCTKVATVWGEPRDVIETAMLVLMVLLDDVFPWSRATFRTDSFVALVDSAGCLGSATMGESPLTTSNCLALRIKRETLQ